MSEAETTLAAAERLFAELTTVLADLTAKRNQLEASVRTHRDRLARLDQDIANVEDEEQKLAQETSGFGDLAMLADTMASAQQNLAESEAAAQGSEAGHVAARSRLEAARAPLNEADKRVQRLETEARTISKLVNGETKNLWPPIIDGVTVAKGYEKALGAALGDDLDAPVDPSAPMRWTHAGVTEGDPALPEGVEALAAHVEAPVRTGAAAGADRRRRQRARRGAGFATQDRPAAGVAGRRRLALGRICRRGPCADRRGTAAGRARPIGRYRKRARAGPHRCLRQAAGAGNRRDRAEVRIIGRDFARATPGAPRSARPMPRASAMPLPSARSTATPRGNRR